MVWHSTYRLLVCLFWKGLLSSRTLVQTSNICHYTEKNNHLEKLIYVEKNENFSFFCFRVKRTLEKLSRTRFLWVLKFPPYFSLLHSREENCGIFKSRKRPFLEACSSIFFPLVVSISFPSKKLISTLKTDFLLFCFKVFRKFYLHLFF